MADGRSRIILASIIIAESLWLFALFSTIGLLVDLEGSPLPWFGMLAILGAAIFAGYLLAGSEGDAATYAIWQALVGIVAIYILLGAASFVPEGSFDIAWLPHLLQGQFEKTGGVRAFFAVIIAVWLWRHGLKLSTDKFPEDRLSRVFKIGITALAVATLVDQARDGGIEASALFLPFFAATLVGLAVGRLPESADRRNAGQWAKIIAVSVMGIMSTGLLIGLAGGLYGGGGVRLLYGGWTLLVEGLLWLLQWPVMWAVAVIDWLLSLIGTRDPATQELDPGQAQSGQEIFGVEPDTVTNTGNSTVDTIVEVLKYPVIALIIIAVFFALALAFRRMSSKAEDEDGDERESIRGDADAADDMARLLGGLVPGLLKGRNRKRWRHPDGQGIAEVFNLYFETLAMGIKWGMRFDPGMTPAERLPLLEAALPGAPVREVTERFNAACYGQEPSPISRVNELSEDLKRAERDIKRS